MKALQNFGTPAIGQLIEHLRDPLYRNGYALAASSLITSGLGVLYWFVAARIYSTEIVGVNSAVLSSILLLANISQLNLMNALNRFIPRAGRATPRLILSAYFTSTIISLVLSLIFVGGIHIWAPSLGFLQGSPFLALWFAFGVATYCIFIQQDSTFTGLRQATWVPIENTIFSIAKLLLLVVFAAIIPQYGVLASWTIPVAITLIPVNWFIFARLVPKHIKQTQDQATPPTVKQVVQYIAGDYLGSLVWITFNNALPILVIQRLGATANAHFYLASTVAYSLSLISSNMGSSLTAEAAAHPEKMGAYSYKVFTRTTMLLLPAVVVLCLIAPLLLSLFGPSYVSESTTLLQLLGISSLPNVIIAIYISVARIQRRTGHVFRVYLATVVLILTLSNFLVDQYGIQAIGAAWLLTQTIIAFVLLVTYFRKLWLPYVNISSLTKVLEGPLYSVWMWRHRKGIAQAAEIFPEVLTAVPPQPSIPDPSKLQIQKTLRTKSDVLVMMLTTNSETAQAFYKVVQSAEGIESLHRQTAALKRVLSDNRLKSLKPLIPAVLAEGEKSGQHFVIESAVSGVESTLMVVDPAVADTVVESAITAIRSLHELTAVCATINDDLINRWVDLPITLITRSLGRRATKLEKAIESLRTELHVNLRGKSLALTFVHGDFWPANVFVSADGSAVTGIIDWDFAVDGGLPSLDLVQYLLSTRMEVENAELGDVVREILNGSGWSDRDKRLLDAAQNALPGDKLSLRDIVLLSWLHHVEANLTKSSMYSTNWFWVAKNVEGVINAL